MQNNYFLQVRSDIYLFPHLYRPNKQNAAVKQKLVEKKMLPKTFQNTLLSRKKNIAKNKLSKYRKKKIVIFSKTFWRNAMTLSSKLSNKVGKIYLNFTFWSKEIFLPQPGASNFKLLSNFKNSASASTQFYPLLVEKIMKMCHTFFAPKLRVRRN